MVSLWEQESFQNYDVILIGAGISGLSTAASLKEKQPNLSILILEGGTLPSGASTRNAGFACFGSISELVEDRKTLGNEGMVSLVKRRWQGLQITIDRLGAENIRYENKGGYELLSPVNAHYRDDLEELNVLLKDAFQKPVFSHADEKIAEFGFRKAKHLILSHYEGQLHTGKLMSALWRYCCSLGVRIITGTKVNEIEHGNTCSVHTAHFSFTAKAVGICTNAFTPAIAKEELDIKPGRGMVMVVTPERALSFQGTFHYDEGYFYFRDFHNKIVFGGGRNLDFSTEETSEFGINKKIEERLLHDLREIIIPGQKFTVDMKWSGIMAFGKSKKPIIKPLNEGVFLGVRLGGMGVAIGSLVGEELAEMILRARF